MGKKKHKKPRQEIEAATSDVCLNYGTFLLIGSHAPRVMTKKSWKEECRSLRVENEQMKQELQNKTEELQNKTEELQRYKDGQSFQQVSENVQNVQVGDNNIQIVHQYENKLEEDAIRMKSIEEEIQRLSTKITDLQELHHLADPKLASPVFSIATDMVMKKITPEIMRLQESIQSLNSYIDEQKRESLCTPEKLSTLSLNETQLTPGDSRHQCTRKATSELILNLHV